MTYKKIVVNPLSGPRLKREIEIKFGERKNAYFAEMVGIEPVTLSYICNGKRALTRDRAEQFGKILGVRPEYLLGVDDCRTYDKKGLTEYIKIDEKPLDHTWVYLYEAVANGKEYPIKDDEALKVMQVISEIKSKGIMR